MKIRIVADSGADIPAAYAEKYKIAIMPMHVGFDDVVLADGSFPVSKIVEYYEKTGKTPKTSAPNPFEFEELFTKIREEDPDCHILYLAYSAITTSTFQSALIASQSFENVTLVDTKHVSMGQGSIVIRMAEWIEKHPEATIEEVVYEAERLREKTAMIFVPDKLEFLKAGGRLSNASAVIGTILNIHPVIEIKDGKLVAVEKVRGSMKKRMPMLLKDKFAEQNLSLDGVWFLRSIGLDDEVAMAAEAMAKEMGITSFRWASTGGVITTHGGPGAFGFVALKKD